MALHLRRDLHDTGIYGDYNRITQWTVDVVSETINFKLSTYVSKLYREEGKSPIEGLTTDLSALFSELPGLDISGDPRAALYDFIKEKPSFAGTIDI